MHIFLEVKQVVKERGFSLLGNSPQYVAVCCNRDSLYGVVFVYMFLLVEVIDFILFVLIILMVS